MLYCSKFPFFVQNSKENLEVVYLTFWTQFDKSNQNQRNSYLLGWSIWVDCSVGKCCTISRRFSNPSFKFVISPISPSFKFVNPSFKFVRNPDSDAPLGFVVVVAAVVAQINATKAKTIFILKTVKLKTKNEFCCSVAMVARMQATGSKGDD